MRHASSRNVGWMLDPRTGLNLPLDQQAKASQDALVFKGDSDLLINSAEQISDELLGMAFDRDMDITGGIRKPFEMLAKILPKMQSNPFLEAFQEVCERYDISLLEVAPVVQIPQENEVVVDNGVANNGSAKVGSANDGVDDDGFDNLTEKHRKSRVRPVGKGWAQKVIDEGFLPGEFYSWSRADGKNGIGAAILLWGRDQAVPKLIEYVQKVEASPTAMADRERWIEWAVPRNNIREDFQAPILRDHRDIIGDVTSEMTEMATKVVDELVKRRRESSLRRKVFDFKALITIQHILELILVAWKNSPDGWIHISQRTLEAGIKQRWEGHVTNQTDILRQLKWITGENSLMPVIEDSEDRKAYTANSYRISSDFIAMIQE